jgi:hypothetical protein
MVTDVGTGFAQSNHLGMGCGIVVGEIAIPSPADHLTFTGDHCSHRRFSYFQSALRAAQCFFHQQFVGRSDGP